MKMASLMILIPPALVLLFTAVASVSETALASREQPGAHGFSRDPLRLLSSMGNNNGSAFAGLSAERAVLQLRPAASRCCSRATGSRSRSSRSRARSPRRRSCRRAPARCPRTPRCSSAWLVGVVLHRRRAHLRSGARARPDRRAPDAACLTRGADAMSDQHESAPPVRSRARAPAAFDALAKLDPRQQVRNPVMFVVLVGSVLTTALFFQALLGRGEAAPASSWVSPWLWFTVLFANFAEAMAEGRGKAQADALRRARRDIEAQAARSRAQSGALRAGSGAHARPCRARTCARATSCWSKRASSSRATARSTIGVASVDESAITGESAPVIREAGGDRSAVTGGTRVLSDWLVVRDHGRAGRDLPRSHDRDGGGRQAPEDARTRSRSTSCSRR